MYIGIKHLHSYTAYLVLALLVLAVINAIVQYIKGASFQKSSKMINLFALIFTHIQLLAGLFIYFISPMGLANFSGEAMKNSMARLYILEHPLMMILAIVAITIGYSKSKRMTEDTAKHRTVMIFYGIGLILILTRIPWTVWP